MANKTVFVKPYATSIIDVIEDYLDDKGVEIPNDEKVGSDTEAHIYGTEFDDLLTDISAIIAEMLEPLEVDINTTDWND